MKMPEIRQRKPDLESRNVKTSPAPDLAPPPMPPSQSFCKGLSVIPWIILCSLLLTSIAGAAGNDQLQEGNSAADTLPQGFEHPRAKKFKRAALHTGSSQDTTKPPFDTCETTECMNLVFEVLPHMNDTVDPCNDFYYHTCGGFINKAKIPDEKDVVARYTMITDRLQDQLLSLLSTEEIHPDDIMPFKLAKFLYDLCMDKGQIRKRGIKPMKNILEKLGGWYILEKDGWMKPEPYWSLVKSVKDLHLQGYINDYFINSSVEVDLKNSSRKIIYLDKPTLGISREDLAKGMDNPAVLAYYNSMVHTTVLLGAEEEQAKRDLSHSLNFEITLANISLPNRKQQNATTLYNPMSVQEMQSEYPYINWIHYFDVVFKDTGIAIDDNEIIIVRNPSYMKQLGPLLQKTPNRILDNYVKWRVINFSLPLLGGVHEHKTRSKECVLVTTTHLPIAVSALYVRKYFNDDSRRVVLDMVYEIKNAFVDILKRVHWMDETTRKSALEKVESMVFHIGYPDELLDDRKIAEYYRHLEGKLWSANNYLKTVLHIKQFDRTKKFKMLRQAVNKTDWTTHSKQAFVYARHSSVENSVQISAGLLQGLLLPPNLPRYMNYGSIGLFIGSAITHACGYPRQQSDKKGSFADWWQADTKEAYQKESDCLIKQYDNYSEQNSKINLNGRSTLGKNIADNGGMKVAYYAYKKWAEKNGPEPRLPSFQLSPEQMFWVSAAQTWCSVYRPEAMKAHITMGYTSPDQFRVLGPMRNMVEFSQDFSCPSGSRMNPKEKCQIW